MADRPELVTVTRAGADDAHVVVRVGDVERTYGVHADRRPPLTVLVAEEGLQTTVRDWPDFYRDLMARCREVLGPLRKAAAA